MKKNRGQFFTPNLVAQRMINDSLRYIKSKNIEILDPCFGEGIFIKNLQKLYKYKYKIHGYEIEKKFYKKVTNNLKKEKYIGELQNSDYLLSKSNKKFDFIIINPPYVRQEKINKKYKENLINSFEKKFSIKIDKKSNLYVYFLLKVILDLKEEGICTIIVYDAIDQTKYGQELIKVIEENCKILKKIKLATPFKKVLVDAKILILKKKKKIKKTKNNFIEDEGFTKFSRIVDVRRGLGLISKKTFEAKQNDNFFSYSKKIILRSANIDKNNKKIIPSYAYIFEKDKNIPKGLKKLLIDKYYKYHKKKLNSFSHIIKTGPIIFNYFFRDKIEFFKNVNNLCVSDNFYILNSKYISNNSLITLLNNKFFKSKIIDNSRNQGSGLHKIQLYELANIKFPDWTKLNEYEVKKLEKKIINNKDNDKILKNIIETPIIK